MQVGERILKRLMGKPGALPAPVAEEQTILVAHDLSPADVIQFKHHHYGAFLTDVGGATSHTAIVARSLNVPAVVATHNARQLIRDSEMLIVDGASGVVIINPDRAVLAEYRLKQSELELERQKLKRLRTKPAETIDGHHVELQANIELPEDLEQTLENGATGVGLFRSEFLFLNREGLPTEDEQFEAYRAVAEGMDGHPVTIRTFDLGADKHVEGLDGLARVAPNPALGLRADPLLPGRAAAVPDAAARDPARFALRPDPHPGADARVGVGDRPDARDDRAGEGRPARAGRSVQLADRGRGHDRDPGRRCIAMDAFLTKLDFLSIGTNDLIQYTLAVDRADEAVAHLYDPLHPAVIRLLALAIGTANKAKVPIAVCGEMAGEVRPDPVAAGPRPAQFLDAPGASADRQAASADFAKSPRPSRSSIASAAPTTRDGLRRWSTS